MTQITIFFQTFFQTYIESSTPRPYSEPSPDIAASKDLCGYLLLKTSILRRLLNIL